jgi:hypothetical protein
VNKPPYTPTRTCPHRWCKPLHLVPVPFGLAIMAFDLWHSWVFLVFMIMSLTLFAVSSKMIHFRRQHRSEPTKIKHVVQDLIESPGPIDLEMEDARYEGTGWRMLEVRKGWARAAVGCDIFVVAIIGLVAMFGSPEASAKSAADAGIDGGMIISVLVGTAFFAFQLYAHKKATQPRKPKRAWVPAFLRTNA